MRKQKSGPSALQADTDINVQRTSNLLRGLQNVSRIDIEAPSMQQRVSLNKNPKEKKNSTSDTCRICEQRRGDGASF